jgi:hypothetical protein
VQIQYNECKLHFKQLFVVLHYYSDSRGLYFGYPNLSCTSFTQAINMHYKTIIHIHIKILSGTEF